jgi:hypothetical protein
MNLQDELVDGDLLELLEEWLEDVLLEETFELFTVVVELLLDERVFEDEVLLELLVEKVELTVGEMLEEELLVDVRLEVLVGDAVLKILGDEILEEVKLDEVYKIIVDKEEELEDNWVELLDDERMTPIPGA